jgi:hypothetical protein
MQFGDYRVEIIQDTEFRLDGGAMFGVVPRKLWSQVCPPDDENRIRMNMNCVFIDTGAEKVLIETGIGDKWTTKQTSMYGIDRTRPLSETLKMQTDVAAGEITIVVNTHLHFDHAGGNTVRDPDGRVRPAFPRARYLMSGKEVEFARTRNIRPSEIVRAICLRTGNRSVTPVSWNRKPANTRLFQDSEWKPSQGTIARCSAGVSSATARRCLVLPISYLYVLISVCPGLWVTTFIR